MKEIWKDIKDYEGFYKISTLGRVLRIKDNKILGYYLNNKGYCCLSLYKDGKTYHPTIHRLVALHFIDNPNNYKQVNHIDCNKENNTIDNLEWCNQISNYNHGKINYLYSKNEDHYFAKLRNEEVRCIPTLFKIGFIRATIAKILEVNPSTIEAIEKKISYRELNLDFNVPKYKYKDLPNIKLPSNVWNIFKDNTVLNTLIAQGKVSV